MLGVRRERFLDVDGDIDQEDIVEQESTVVNVFNPLQNNKQAQTKDNECRKSNHNGNLISFARLCFGRHIVLDFCRRLDLTISLKGDNHYDMAKKQRNQAVKRVNNWFKLSVAVDRLVLVL